jgi:hypothetical protein
MVMDKHMGHTEQQETQVMRFKGIRVRFERETDISWYQYFFFTLFAEPPRTHCI